MANTRRIYLIAGIMAVAFAAFLAVRRTGPDPINLPGAIQTVAEGYEAILSLKNLVANDGQLSAAFVELDRKDAQFEVAKIMFAFESKRAMGEGLPLIMVDNATHTAFYLTEFPKSVAPPPGFDQSLEPLDAAPIPLDVPDVLKLATENGLDEFCTLVPPADQQVELRLMNSPKGPMWHVVGDGWTDGMPLATLFVVIDARTGSVVSRDLQKGAKQKEVP
jgi:hypothetical protein